MQKCAAAFTAVVLLLTGAYGDVRPRKIGCKAEASLKLDKFVKDFPVGLTPVRCAAVCFNMAFTHAAAINGSTCKCGDLEEGSGYGSDGICTSPCSGDPADRCGGPTSYTLYETGLKEVSEDDVEDYEIGCLIDGEDERLIPLHKQDLPLTNTPKKCIEYCRALGFQHAGVEYSFECFCGEAARLSPTVPGCDLPCVADEEQTCGGNWKMNVYRTGVSIPPKLIKMKGCYPFSKNKILAETVMEMLEPNKCIAYCFDQGFKIAYLHNGRNCMCSNVFDGKKGKVEQCNSKCPGNDQEFCGSATHSNMYTTGIIGERSAGKLIGCFLDLQGSLLKGPVIDLGENNSPDKCIAKCIELGHSYAGLRNTTECICANAAPRRIPIWIKPQSNCANPCPGDPTMNCGAKNKISLYRTGLSTDVSRDECIKSMSTFNGTSVCGGILLFEDEFNNLDLSKWEHVVRFSGEEGEFVTYTGNNENIFISDGKLVIKPTLMEEETVRGRVKLAECTSSQLQECTKTAKSYDIVPPVKSAQICTKESLSFKYGVVTVRAKLPKGDWIVPEIILRPKYYAYGPGFKSGRGIIAQAYGNDDLITEDNINIGSNMLKSGLQASTRKEGPLKEKMTLMPSSGPWYNQFHNYSIKWTKETSEFYLDGNLLNLKCTYMNFGTPVTEEMGFDDNELRTWQNGSHIAPFDQEFYICLGVSAGGNTAFPDNVKSNGKPKPWSNYKIKGMLDFWKARDEWYPSWSEKTKMEIDYISLTSF